MKAAFVLLFLAALSGCLDSEEPEPEPQPEPVEQPAQPAPEDWKEERTRSATNVAIGVGGTVLDHAFRLYDNATLTLTVAWDIPPATVQLWLEDEDGRLLDETAVPEDAFSSESATIDIGPGNYTAGTRLFGVSSLYEYSFEGQFS